VYVNKFSHTRFEPMGHTKNPDIRIAKSIVDYIFRWLGIEFLAGYREAMLGHSAADESHGSGVTEEDSETERGLAAKKAGEPTSTPGSATQAAVYSAIAQPAARKRAAQNGASLTTAADNASLLERAGVMKVDLNGGGNFANRAEQFASFQTDAPSCDNCGAITVRNGNCYLCHNCGNSMGCS